jgi:hypothetical protein
MLSARFFIFATYSAMESSFFCVRASCIRSCMMRA